MAMLPVDAGTAGGAAANLLAPPDDSKNFETVLLYLDGIRDKQAFAFSVDKINPVEKGLDGCLKRYEQEERWIDYQMQENKNSQFGKLQP